MKAENKKVTVKMSKKMKFEMQKSVCDLGYGSRGKSKWLSDALIRFQNLSNITRLIEEGDKVNQGNLIYTEAFYLSEMVYETLRNIMICARKDMPLLLGVQSSVIRASIIARLVGI